METIMIYDDFLRDELPKYLLSQEGIKKVEVKEQGYLSKITVEYDNNTNPYIINEYIKIFQEHKEPKLSEFKKGLINNIIKYNYKIDDICCEYCYKNFIDELFKNHHIESVKSTFNYQKSVFEVNFTIEYDENYSEKELTKFLKEKE